MIGRRKNRSHRARQEVQDFNDFMNKLADSLGLPTLEEIENDGRIKEELPEGIR